MESWLNWMHGLRECVCKCCSQDWTLLLLCLLLNLITSDTKPANRKKVGHAVFVLFHLIYYTFNRKYCTSRLNDGFCLNACFPIYEVLVYNSNATHDLPPVQTLSFAFHHLSSVHPQFVFHRNVSESWNPVHVFLMAIATRPVVVVASRFYRATLC